MNMQKYIRAHSARYQLSDFFHLPFFRCVAIITAQLRMSVGVVTETAYRSLGTKNKSRKNNA
jgi:hypothetical protein